jgi:isopenicillin N synthase-like dioxygenase
MTSTLALAEISVRNLHKPEVIRNLVSMSKQVGFIRLVDLDLNISMDRMFQASKQFFELDDAAKMKCATQPYCAANKNVYRGFFPVIPGSDSFKEGFEFGWDKFKSIKPNHPLHEASVFPEQLSPAWLSDVQTYFDDMMQLGNKLLRAYEIGLELTEGQLTQLFFNSMSTFRFIRYPQRAKSDANDETGQLEKEGKLTFSTPSHVDSGILTLLLQDNTGGLQAMSSDGEWMDISPIPNTLVMNLGALLQTLTSGEVKATKHRVIAPTHERYSMPFFFEPSPNAVMEPCINKTEQEQTEHATYEDYLLKQMEPFAEYEQLLKAIR